MNNYYIGIDIGGTAVKIGLVEENGTLHSSSSYPVNFDNYETPIIDTVVKQTEVFLEKNNIALETVNGIGISATGHINTLKGTVEGSAGHIKNWLGTPIVERLTNHFHKPTTLANDANCAAIGEKWLGAAKSYHDVIMVTIGTGVGGGIIVNDKILSGAIGIAGELGHFSIKKDGIPCSCGNIGCLEQYGSTSALVRRVQQSIYFDTLGVTPEQINGTYIFQQAEARNPHIMQILNDWIADIALGITGLIHIFNPSLIVIGGGVSQQQTLFINPLTTAIMNSTMPCFRKNLTITAASLGNNAGILGAVANHLTNTVDTNTND